jgi:hypothetical protein
LDEVVKNVEKDEIIFEQKISWSRERGERG